MMMMMSPNNAKQVVGDTTYTKIFVGGLAWETKRDSLKRYFEQFGDILEAVVITDRNTSRSKGYGFVTFKHPDSAIRACQNPYPLIDGRRANCNLAVLGSHNKFNPSSSPPVAVSENFSTSSSWTNMVPIPFQATSSSYYNQHIPQYYTLPFPPYRYPTYPPPQEIYAMNYYNAYGGQQQQQFQNRWRPAAYYPPFYGVSQYSRMPPEAYVKKTHYPEVPPHQMYTVVGLPEAVIPVSPSLPTTAGVVTAAVDAGGNKNIGSSPEHKSSSA